MFYVCFKYEMGSYRKLVAKHVLLIMKYEYFQLICGNFSLT